MIEKISVNTTDKLIASGIIQAEDIEIYKYGIRILVQDTINLVCIFLTGLIMNALTECIFLFIPFALIRKFSGGIHAEKYSVCFLVSNSVMIGSVLFIKHLSFNSAIVWVSMVLRSNVNSTGCYMINQPKVPKNLDKFKFIK